MSLVVNTALQAVAELCPYPSWTPVRHMYRPQLFSDRQGSELHSFPMFFQVCVGWASSFLLVLVMVAFALELVLLAPSVTVLVFGVMGLCL